MVNEIQKGEANLAPLKMNAKVISDTLLKYADKVRSDLFVKYKIDQINDERKAAKGQGNSADDKKVDLIYDDKINKFLSSDGANLKAPRGSVTAQVTSLAKKYLYCAKNVSGVSFRTFICPKGDSEAHDNLLLYAQAQYCMDLDDYNQGSVEYVESDGSLGTSSNLGVRTYFAEFVNSNGDKAYTILLGLNTKYISEDAILEFLSLQSIMKRSPDSTWMLFKVYKTIESMVK